MSTSSVLGISEPPGSSNTPSPDISFGALGDPVNSDVPYFGSLAKSSVACGPEAGISNAAFSLAGSPKAGASETGLSDAFDFLRRCQKMIKAALTSRTPAGTHIPIAILALVDKPVVFPPAVDESAVLLVDADADAVLVIKKIGLA
jgi:hypothetical protein